MNPCGFTDVLLPFLFPNIGPFYQYINLANVKGKTKAVFLSIIFIKKSDILPAKPSFAITTTLLNEL